MDITTPAPGHGATTGSIQEDVKRAIEQEGPNPSIELAAERFENTLPKDAQGKLLPVWSTPLSGLGRVLGGSYELYFRFIAVMAFLFLVMALVSTPALIQNYQGAGDTKSPLNDFSLGHASKVSVWHLASDVAIAVLYVLVWAFVASMYPEWVATTSGRTWTASDYTVVAKDLHESVEVGHIERYFSHWGKLHDVTLSKQDQDLVQAYHNSVTARNEFVKAVVVRHRGGDKAADIEKDSVVVNLHAASVDADAQVAVGRCMDRPCAGMAFVTFESATDAFNCVQAHGRWTHKWLGFYTRDIKTDELPHNADVLLGSTRVVVHRAPDPTDIMWENLCCGSWSQLFRQICTTLVGLLLVTISTICLVLLSWLNMWGGMEDDDSRLLCVGLATIGIVLSNVVIFFAVPVMAWSFEKHHTKMLLERSVAFKLLFFQLANAVVVCFGFSYWTGGKLNADWYDSGGLAALGVALGDMTVILLFVELGRPDIFVRRYLLGGSAVLQSELDALWTPWEFSFSFRYQLLVKFAIFAMLFSAAEPLVLIISCIAFVESYWIDKFNILRRLPKPSKVGHQVSRSIIVYILPWASVFHLACSLEFFEAKGVPLRSDASSPLFLVNVLLYLIAAVVTTVVFAALLELLGIQFLRNGARHAWAVLRASRGGGDGGDGGESEPILGSASVGGVTPPNSGRGDKGFAATVGESGGYKLSAPWWS